MKRFAAVMVERLQATRLRLLDVYGQVRRSLSPPARRARWCRCPTGSRDRRRETARHLDARARAASATRSTRFRPGQFAMLYAFGAGEVPISVSGDLTPAAARAHDPRGRRRHAPRSAPAPRRRGRRARPVRHRLAGRGGRGRDVVVVAGGIGLAPLRPAIYHLLANRERYGRVVAPLRRPLARRSCSTPTSSSAGAGASTSRSRSTVDAAAAGWRGQRRRGHDADRRAPTSTPADTVAMVCGPEVMMRFTSPRCGSAASPADAIFVSMERNMKCAVGYCGHCQLGPRFVCKDGPVFALDARRAAARGCGSCDGDAEHAEARGLEVRLLRRLPAQRCSTARTSCSRSPARSRSPTSSRRRAPTVEGPYDLSLVEGSITTPDDAERIQRGAARSRGAWSRSAPARPRAGSRRCATSPTSTSSSPSSTRRPSTSRRSTTSTADLRARPRRLRAAGLPDRQAPAARGDQRLPERAPAGDRRRTASASSASARGNVCVMVAHGTPCLGPVTHAGCGALCPSYDRGCYGCFGPMETPQHRVAAARGSRALGMRGGRPRARLPHVQRERRAVPRGERGA